MNFGELGITPTQSKILPSLSVSSLEFDSRKVSPGALFFAVPGNTADGHAYLPQVFRAGAVGAVVQSPEAYAQWDSCVLVPDVRAALAQAADRWYGHPSGELSLVGITGTNGKTTCAFLLFQVWESLGLVGGLLGTVETRIGKKRATSSLTTPDPLTVQRRLREMVDGGVSHAAMEVSSIALDQSRTGGTEFAAGIFTNLTQDHLDYHSTMESYFAAKQRLFEEHSVGHRILNADDDWAARLGRDEDALFGRAATANYRVSEVKYSMLGSEFEVHTPAGVFPVRLPLIGAHNVANAVAVLAACDRLGLETLAVIEALASAPGAPGRLERAHGNDDGGPYVFVDYAHTEDALANVLDGLVPLKGKGRLITVFGCGGDRDREKRPRMARAASSRSDVTIATSDNPRTEDPNQILDDLEPGIERDGTEYHREVDRRRAIHLALEMADGDAIVLIAGKGHEDYQVLGTEKIHFDDREVVREFFSR